VLNAVVVIGILIMFACLVYKDITECKLPNWQILVLAMLSLLFSILSELTIEQMDCSAWLINHATALLPVSGFYLAVYVASRGELIGLGDVKLGVPIAILLSSWQEALLTLILANVLAMIIIVPLMITKKISVNKKVPFGPFLITACLLIFFGMKFFVNFF